MQIKKEKYEGMKESIERLRETVEVLSSKRTIKKLEMALMRVEAGKYLVKKDLLR